MSAVETFSSKAKYGSNSITKDSRKTLWSDSEGEGSDHEDRETKQSIASKQDTKRETEKPKESDQKFTSDFDSEWDRFPTSQEFKNIYGEAIWERLSGSYNDLAKSLDTIEQKSDKPQEKRTTCWDAIDNKPVVSTEESYVPERPPKLPGEKGKVGRPPGRPRLYPDLTPEQVEEKKRFERAIIKDDPDQPRVKRKYTKRADKEKMLAELAAKGELSSDNKGYKPRATRGDAKNSAPRFLQCLHCDKRFESKGQARPHLEVHSGIKPYKCSACDYKSYSKHNVTDAHFTKKHGRKGTSDDIITDPNDKQNLKALVIMESEQMLERQDKLDRELANQTDLDQLANVPKDDNETPVKDISSDSLNNVEKEEEKPDDNINASEEWLEKMSKEMYETNDEEAKVEDNNEEDEEDTNISPDLLDSLCAETDSTETKDTNQNPTTELQTSNHVEVKRKRASSYDSSSDFENINTKKLDWVPESKKAALEEKITSLEKSKESSTDRSDEISNSTIKEVKKRKRFSSDITQSSDQNPNYDWLPAAKKPTSDEINKSTSLEVKQSDTKVFEDVPVEKVEDVPLEKVEDEINDNDNEDEKEGDENNNEDDSVELKPLPEKGKINDFIQKLPKKELTDPIEIQLAQVTGKGPKPMAKCRICQREGRQDNIKNHVQRMHPDRVVDLGSE